jgi:hypothetical protein
VRDLERFGPLPTQHEEEQCQPNSKKSSSAWHGAVIVSDLLIRMGELGTLCE